MNNKLIDQFFSRIQQMGKRFFLQIKQANVNWVLLISLGSIIFIMAIFPNAFPDWVGFGAYDATTQVTRAKTLWDWMELLVVPATLTLGVFWLGERQAENERKINEDNQHQARLDLYIDKMSDLLLNKQLRNSSDRGEIGIIARTITLTLFQQIDGARKGNALQFLFESGLILLPNPVIPLSGLNINNALLSGASLSKVYLRATIYKNANLTNARFIDSDLIGCDFSGSDLKGANFTGAQLQQAIFVNCNLLDVDFSGADLEMADFTNARVTLEQLKKAKKLNYATLEDGDIYWPQETLSLKENINE